jgi:hypothetical protein
VPQVDEAADRAWGYRNDIGLDEFPMLTRRGKPQLCSTTLSVRSNVSRKMIPSALAAFRWACHLWRYNAMLS